MRIHCPFCGSRDSSEFIYQGDATVQRPDPDAPDAEQQFFEAVYLRTNPAGPHEEYWYHAAGCRSWLRVQRDTRTHEIGRVAFASGEARERAAATVAAAGISR
ncbi:sarcosine oxidase subunit delta [Paraburkholderia sp. ZP32-5]|uniref:sarcosine oxidase subunit delta n=1 Tax=Paraburkholderia sp. ZP32-5 TaxID=2883245 RepID=UPI001F212361|nr:sarcosine oxidase subunit delta [Paraburkholderia sp. ZP32-5]